MRKDDLIRMADERYGKGQGRFVYFSDLKNFRSCEDGLPRPLQLRPLQSDPGQGGGGGGGGEHQPRPGQPGGAALHKD